MITSIYLISNIIFTTLPRHLSHSCTNKDIYYINILPDNILILNSFIIYLSIYIHNCTKLRLVLCPGQQRVKFPMINYFFFYHTVYFGEQNSYLSSTTLQWRRQLVVLYQEEKKIELAHSSFFLTSGVVFFLIFLSDFCFSLQL